MAKSKKIKKEKEKGKKEKKSRREKRVISGIKNFDILIGEGFLPGSVNLLIGGVGSGKTVFSIQFLMQGLQKGENVLYISLEEKKEDMFESMAKFGWDLKKFEDSGKLFFLEYSPEGIKKMVDEGGGELESVISRKKIKRLAIDNLSFFEMMYDSDLSRSQAMSSLCEILRAWECTALIILQKDVGTREMTSELAIDFETESIIVLYFLRKGPTRERQLEILKMKETDHSRKLHNFEIGDKGIIVKK